jgi:hypothetical protein
VALKLPLKLKETAREISTFLSDMTEVILPVQKPMQEIGLKRAPSLPLLSVHPLIIGVELGLQPISPMPTLLLGWMQLLVMEVICW